LNIDQGTAIAYEGWPYPWGILLNPGGRLNVNGSPTNRVIFARLEAVQENPVLELEAYGPMISWRNFVLYSGLPIAPYPEAKINYADFYTVAGGWNAHFDAPSEYHARFYSVVKTLELDGCQLQGGWFAYEDAGPPDRNLKI